MEKVGQKGKSESSAGATGASDGKKTSSTSTGAPRRIPGNLPYVNATGTLKRILDKVIEAQRPDKFNYDFLENVIKITGGAARATIPILKRIGFLASDGTPTELYAKFKTESGRGQAALQGLKNGFPEIFKRSEYAHVADDKKIKDLIIEITGLEANDQVASAIRSTFNVIRGFVPAGISEQVAEPGEEGASEEVSSRAERTPPASVAAGIGPLGLSYHINVVLPETSDLTVLNAIFRSIKENLLR